MIDQSTADALARFGVTLPVQTVPDDALLTVLWRDRNLYTLLAFDRLTIRYRMLDLTDLPTPSADGRTLLLPIDTYGHILSPSPMPSNPNSSHPN